MRLRPATAALIALLLAPSLGCLRPHAGTRGAVGGGAPSSLEDAKLLWEEAVRTNVGLAFTFKVYGFPSEAEARAACKGYPPCASAKEKRTLTYFSNELPLAFRERLLRLSPSELSPPLLAPQRDRYLVFEKVREVPGDFLKETPNPGEWLRAYAATSLPSAAALRTDPELKARRVLNRVRSSDDLAAALANGAVAANQLDMSLSNGSTSLTLAIILKNAPLAVALLDAGASPDVCGVTECPLSTAVSMRQPEIVKALLARRANPDGAADEQHSPLMQAALRGDRELAQALLDAGADPLQSRSVFIVVPWLRSTLFYAAANPDFLAWYAPIFKRALDKAGKYKWDAWVEQDGKRTRITDRATVTLAPRPFRVVFAAGEGVPFRVAASDSPAFLDAIDSLQSRQSIVSPMKVAAIAADDRSLVVWRLKGGVPPEGNLDAGSSEWSLQPDPAAANGTRRQRAAKGSEFVHDVAVLYGLENDAVPLQKQAGGTLHVVLGTLPPLGDGSDFYEPRRVTLKFKK